MSTARYAEIILKQGLALLFPRFDLAAIFRHREVMARLNEVDNKLKILIGTAEKSAVHHLRDALTSYDHGNYREAYKQFNLVINKATDGYNNAGDNVDSLIYCTRLKLAASYMIKSFDKDSNAFTTFELLSAVKRLEIAQSIRNYLDDLLKDTTYLRKEMELKFWQRSKHLDKIKEIDEKVPLMVTDVYPLMSQGLGLTKPTVRIEEDWDALTFKVMPKYMYTNCETELVLSQDLKVNIMMHSLSETQNAFVWTVNGHKTKMVPFAAGEMEVMLEVKRRDVVSWESCPVVQMEEPLQITEEILTQGQPQPPPPAASALPALAALPLQSPLTATAAPPPAALALPAPPAPPPPPLTATAAPPPTTSTKPPPATTTVTTIALGELIDPKLRYCQVEKDCQENTNTSRVKKDLWLKLFKSTQQIERGAALRDPGLRAVALYDWLAEDDNDISLEIGQEITDIEMLDEGWWVGKAPNGKVGLFPANYVKLI